MGRTVMAFRPALETEIKSWDDFQRGLRPKDRKAFERLASHARIHADAGSLAARPELSQVFFMSVLLEHQKEIEYLKTKIEKLEKMLNDDEG
jgi:hypothetical protein